MRIIRPSRDYLGQSWGASWGHLGHTWGHLGIPSAVWEIWLHALRLATLERASRSHAKTGLSSGLSGAQKWRFR